MLSNDAVHDGRQLFEVSLLQRSLGRDDKNLLVTKKFMVDQITLSRVWFRKRGTRVAKLQALLANMRAKNANVCFGSKADIGESTKDVRFTPKNGHPPHDRIHNVSSALELVLDTM